MHHSSPVDGWDSCLILYNAGSLMLMLDDAMSIFARTICSPSLHSPARICQNSRLDANYQHTNQNQIKPSEIITSAHSIRNHKNASHVQYPSLTFSKSSKFSSTLLDLKGLSFPGSVNEPLYSLISSALKLSTYASPLLISSLAQL